MLLNITCFMLYTICTNLSKIDFTEQKCPPINFYIKLCRKKKNVFFFRRSELIFQKKVYICFASYSSSYWKQHILAKSLASSQLFPKWANNWCQNTHLATTWCLSLVLPGSRPNSFSKPFQSSDYHLSWWFSKGAMSKIQLQNKTKQNRKKPTKKKLL